MRLSAAFRNACRGFPTGSINRSRTGVRVFVSKPVSVGSGNSQLFARDGSSSSGGRSVGAAVKFGQHHEQAAATSYDISLRELMQRSKDEITSLQKRYPTVKPLLAIIQAGEDDALLEINKTMAGKIGLDVIHISLPVECTEDEIIEEVLKLNEDRKVHGVALHLPQASLTRRVLNSLKPEKDVDGVTDLNIGRLIQGDVTGSFIPPVASAVVELLGRHDSSVEGKMAVIVGENRPLELVLQSLMQARGMFVLSSTWTTDSLQKQVLQADVIVLASAGRTSVPPAWVRPGAAVINCGPALVSGELRAAGMAVEMSVAAGGGVFGGGPEDSECGEKQSQVGAEAAVPAMEPTQSQTAASLTCAQTPKAIDLLAEEIGLLADELEAYGHTKAKVRLSLLDRLKEQPNGKYILVAGITPTPLGEGKSTVTIGLVQALTAHLKLNSFACLRQPSQGPTFGVKGGAAGGGYAQVIPMEEFNLHLTGDIHAITAANNLVAAAIDARILHEATQSDKALYSRLVPAVSGFRRFSPIQVARLQRLGIGTTDPAALTPEEVSSFVRLDLDPAKVTWQRVVDTNDRFLRKITVGQANTEKH
ncbi:hypothetical protein SKAU_G00185220 [Synaphobranchus kaupii]|uniref:formate--tetrahydrofolate ligase n=1 Tax=Synaphobranchus kaupii TaxID=118154 RepID=A0A9Q1FCC4_SYNKA|nr:hypothetical protein SKAU_G00185220 [Synaphobranchus kaupii]